MDPLVNTETTLNSSVQNNANLTSIRIGSSTPARTLVP
jgi:hypothetical protein